MRTSFLSIFPSMSKRGRIQAVPYRQLLLVAGVLTLEVAVVACKESAHNPTPTPNSESDSSLKSSAYNRLTPEEENVILHKGTERPFTGEYYDLKEAGTYICKRCNSPLYKSASKFDSGCGWPSFDDEIPGAVRRQVDADGSRTEILCAHCGAHLGHVFLGEGFTPKNTRHCVNSISMRFIPKGDPLPPALSADSGKDGKSASAEPRDPSEILSATSEFAAASADKANDLPATDTAIFASGCFWGTQYMLEKAKGVLSTRVGYTGGHTSYPTYRDVCSGTTGHAEALEVVFDPRQISYEDLAKLFFETHDPTQVNRQGPDVGEQYRSVIFYRNEEQKITAENLIAILKSKGLRVATQLVPASTFWPAEDYHQDYYERTGGAPYCHRYVKRF